MRTVQILRDRQQKVATAQLGDRDVFGLKVGPSGGVIQVFAMRGGRVVERVELATEPGAVDGGDADVLQAAVQQFYDVARAAVGDQPARWRSRTARRSRRGCRRAPGGG